MYAGNSPDLASGTQPPERTVVPRGRMARLLAGLLRFFGLWAGISGTYAMMATCPCCGKPGCPVGLGGAAIVGALGSLIINYGRRWFSAVWRHIRRLR